MKNVQLGQVSPGLKLNIVELLKMYGEATLAFNAMLGFVVGLITICIQLEFLHSKISLI